MAEEKKVTVYGCMECPDTVAALELFGREGVAYRFVEVLESLGALREFLNIRDANPELFAGAVRDGGVGIPVVSVEGGGVFTDIESLDLALLK